MRRMLFKAYAVTNEINLNVLAAECNIPKKYTWEEPLALREDTLGAILGRRPEKDEIALVFSFGSVVCVNMPKGDTHTLIDYLRAFAPEIPNDNWGRYTDDYELRVDHVAEIELTDEYITVPSLELFHPELIATVIAKSVALEKTEHQLGTILDKLESMIDRLEDGKLRIGDKELARTVARIVRHQYNTINYIMILDKPDVTWSNMEAAEFYERMSEFFELSDRFEIMTKKTDILDNIITGFSSISHSIRGLFVEWVIVLLIVLEVILMTADLLR